MTHRFLVSVSGLGVPIAVMLLAPVPAAGQAASAAANTNAASARAYTAPRTPDGQPDLQGFWTNTTYTPLERPQDVTKEFYTREEAIELSKQAATAEGEQTEPGTIPDVHYDFTQFGLDRSQGGFALNLRISMIVDPPRRRAIWRPTTVIVATSEFLRACLTNTIRGGSPLARAVRT